MDALSDDLFYVVLEHIWSLNDLEALWLTNRRAARLCTNMSSKTLWRIAYRTCWADCKRHQEEEDGMGSPCDCSVVVPALQEPESVPFKVRAWLYQRASVRSFGTSKEVLGRCIVQKNNDLENPYEDRRYGWGKLSTECEEDSDPKPGEWARFWLIFKRYLVMQRVQRVNLGDGTVRPQLRRTYEPVKDEDEDEEEEEEEEEEEDEEWAEALREANSLMGRKRDRNVVSWR